MEGWGEMQESMKADIDQLKNQMSQMFEMMVAFKDAIAARNEEAQSSQQGGLQTRKPNHGNKASQEFPPYGLPLNYEPPYEEYEEQETMPPVANAVRGQPVYTQIPLASNAEKVVINKAPSTTQPRVLQVLTGEASAIRDNIPKGIQIVLINADMTKRKLDILEERLRMIEGASAYEFGNVVRLCLVPDVVIPLKFKVSKFEKYKGVTCPKSHMIMYCKKMAAHAHDEKLLMHFFQDSLAGMALNWYMHLEPARIHLWKDLSDAFLKQYKYNMDMALDRMQLQGMTKKSSETSKEYAQRWRELAAQVAPSLHESEMITMFVETLEDPFYERVLRSVSSNFLILLRSKKGLNEG